MFLAPECPASMCPCVPFLGIQATSPPSAVDSAWGTHMSARECPQADFLMMPRAPVELWPLAVPVARLGELLGVHRAVVERMLSDPAIEMPPVFRIGGQGKRFMRYADVVAWVDALAASNDGRTPDRNRRHLIEAAKKSAAVRAAAAAARRAAIAADQPVPPSTARRVKEPGALAKADAVIIASVRAATSRSKSRQISQRKPRTPRAAEGPPG